MPIKIKCPHCSEKYVLTDQYAGRKVRCKHCGEAIRVPDPKPKTPRSLPERKRPVPLERPAEPVIEDYDEVEPEDYGFDEIGEEYAPPAAPKRSRSRGRRRKSSSSGFSAQRGWMIYGGVFLLSFLLSLFLSPVSVLFMILAVLSGLAFTLWGGISIISAAFKEDVSCGLLYLFVPFYSLYFIATRWDKCCKPVLVGFVGVVAFLSVLASNFIGDSIGGIAFSSGGAPVADANTPDAELAAAPERDRLQRRPRGNSIPFSNDTASDLQLFPLRSFSEKYPRLTGNPRFRQRELNGIRIYDLALDRQSQQSGRPGEGMALRLYLPSGSHEDHSLTCVLVPPAGTNLLVGSEMDPGYDNAEHLPYVKAGYAVVTFSLDGWQGNREGAADSEVSAGYKKFRSAYAGLVNAKIAFQFAANAVKEIDPKSIYIAGHSSAATLALLFAAHEPKLAGCMAYAPETDVEAAVGDVTSQLSASQFPGIQNFVKQSSPVAHVSHYACPVFLYHASGDQVVPMQRTQLFANKLGIAKKRVLMSRGSGSDHYQTMVAQGIPRGLSWLRKQSLLTTPGTGRPDRGDIAQNEPAPEKKTNPFQKIEERSPEKTGESGGAGKKSTKGKTYRFSIQRIRIPIPNIKEKIQSVLEKRPDYIPGSFSFDSANDEFSVQLDGSIFASYQGIIQALAREKRIIVVLKL